jgi:hypothetical protein
MIPRRVELVGDAALIAYEGDDLNVVAKHIGGA